MKSVVELVDRLKNEDPNVVDDAVQKLAKLDGKLMKPVLDLLIATEERKVEQAILRVFQAVDVRSFECAKTMLSWKRQRRATTDYVRNIADLSKARKEAKHYIGMSIMPDSASLVVRNHLLELCRYFPPVIEDLIEAFESNPQARDGIGCVLGVLAKKELNLRKYLWYRVTESNLKKHVIVALAEAGDTGVSSILVDAFVDDHDVMSPFWYLLMDLGAKDASVRGSILNLLRKNDYLLRLDTSCLLGEMLEMSPDALVTLLDALTDPDDKVRAGVADALAHAHEKSRPALPKLIQALRDPIAEVRRAVANAIANSIGETDANTGLIHALIESTKDAEADVRAWAARSLKKIGPAARIAIPDLLKLLTDDMTHVREAAVEALARLAED